ncbi:hypothetical protein Bbelb_304840 [Branchiostoma belcheri]|nr:hypothetical protein Bbelb_304840 [Branchiostoma belcheri]
MPGDDMVAGSAELILTPPVPRVASTTLQALSLSVHSQDVSWREREYRAFLVIFRITRKFPNKVRILIKVRTPDLWLRPPIDPWGATIIEAENWAGFYCYFCSEERNTSFSGPKFWKAQSSALPRPSLRSFSVLGYFMRCQGNSTNTGATPVGAYRLDPPTGRR